MIRITYDERSERIRIDIDPYSEEGISTGDMVLHMAAITHVIADFVSKETKGVISITHFLNALCSLGDVELQDISDLDTEEKE